MMSGIVRNNTHRQLNVEEFRAFTIIDEYAPLIFINATDSESGKLFSLLHEFVHICVGKNNLFNENYGMITKASELETLCNAVSAELLVPSKLFHSIWREKSVQNSSTDQIIAQVASYFKCGRVIIARKALDAGRIERAEYSKVVEKTIEDYNRTAQTRRKKGGDYYLTKKSRIDTRFLTFVIDSVSRGKTLYSEAFRLTNTNSYTFSELTTRMFL